MKSCFKSLVFLCFLGVSVVNAFSLDREAFTLTNYDLNLQIEPEQQRLRVRGKITLRNDSLTPQRIAVLQISSSLDWRSVKAADKPLQFVTQPYTSDMDHTGVLSEAIVTLPQALPPKGTIELEIGYEGVIVLDATRLTRIGTPEPAAKSSDWDQISARFTAVRGAGYVAWYPLATEAANLSEGDSLYEVLGRWKAREAASGMEVRIETPAVAGDVTPPVTLCGGTEVHAVTRGGSPKFPWSQCSYQPLGLSVPAFIVANYVVANYVVANHVVSNYELIDRPAIAVYHLPEHTVAAVTYADAAEKTAPFITEWFGAFRRKAETADLAELGAAPFESGSLLLTPLTATDSKLAGLVAAHQLVHASFSSPRPWIEEGLAHFAQALYLEHEKGRQAALDYMGLHRSAFSEAEKPTTSPRPEDELNRSLVNTASEELYRSKAMYVWWMLRDMIGEDALKRAIRSYHPEQDKDPSYMPKLIAAQTQRDLEWFFDDWVYRDRGLPDFKVDSAFSRKTATDTFLVTISVDNLGAAGAEVPVTVKFTGGEVSRRLEVRGKNKAVIRIEVPRAPQEIVVNDGGVPEGEMANNTFKIEGTEK